MHASGSSSSALLEFWHLELFGVGGGGWFLDAVLD